jgi:hypothetical protein
MRFYRSNTISMIKKGCHDFIIIGIIIVAFINFVSLSHSHTYTTKKRLYALAIFK